MKKTLLSLLAFLAATAGFAQENLAVGQTAIATSGNAAAAVDNNTGTRWESSSSDPQTWQVDLGSSKTFNTISINWEGAYASTFTVEVGDVVDADGYLTGGTQVISVSGQTLSGFPYVQNFGFETQTARYVKFNGINRGTPYGYSFWEFGVYNLEAPLSLAAINITVDDKTSAEAVVGDVLSFVAKGTDQLGGIIETGELTWTSSAPAVGTIDNSGMFAAVAAGTTTVTAAVAGIVSNAVSVTVLAGEKIDLFTNWQYRIYTVGDETLVASRDGAVDNNDGSLWVLHDTTPADEASRTYETGFIADLGGIYDINSISIHFEGACSEAFTLSFAGNDGEFGPAVYTGGVAGINNHTENFSGQRVTGARYVKMLSTKASSEWGVKIYDFSVVGTKTADVDNSGLPTLSKAEVKATEDESVTLTLNADDDASKYLYYEISANGVPATLFSAKAGQDTDVVIEKLNGGTTYNFAIFAIDAEGNRSAVKELSATTGGETFVLTAAPAPTADASNVISVYSNAYEAATAWNIGGWGQSTVVAYESVDGDELMKLSNYNYLGFEYATDLDLSEMEYLHVDVLPMEASSFGITPIMRNAPTENSQNVGSLKVKEWNSIDLPLSQFGLEFDGNSSFQLKIDGGTGAVVYVDNIYFYKKSESGNGGDDNGDDNNDDQNESSGSGSYVIPSGLNAGKTLNYTWAFTQTDMDVTVTFACTNADEIIGIVDGYVFDKTVGFAEREGLSYTWTNCASGQVITAAHKWMFAEGDFVTPDFQYTVVGPEVNLVDEGADERGIVKLTGTWNADEFAAIDADEQANAYDLTEVADLPAQITALNPNAQFVIAAADIAKAIPNGLAYEDGVYYSMGINFVDDATSVDHSINTTLVPVMIVSGTAPTYTRTLPSANVWASAYLPFPAQTGDNKFYELGEVTTENDLTIINLTTVEGDLQPGTPYIVKAASTTITAQVPANVFAGTMIEAYGETPVQAGGVSFQGTYQRLAADEVSDAYVLNGNGANLVFKQNTFDIPAFRAYMTGLSAASKISVVFDGDVNGINALSDDALRALFNVYSIDGKLVKAETESLFNLPKGVYVVNGRKVVVK